MAERTKVDRFRGRPGALREWQSRMGYTNAGAAAALDIGLTTWNELVREDSRIDLRTALACAAIEQGVKPLQ